MERHDDPTARALTLLSCFTGRSHWTGAELAARLGVTTRTLRRDVERLRVLGYDIDGSSGTDGGYRLRAGGDVPPLFFESDEAVAVVAALLAAVGDQTTGMVDASSRALSKLHHVLPTALQRRADAVQASSRTTAIGRAPVVDPQSIATLAESCRDAVAVRFAYRRRDGTLSHRRVEPNSMVTVRSVWYLIAWDLARDDWRTFRVDRVDGPVETTGHGARRRVLPGGDPLAHLGESLATMPYDHNADIDIEADRHDVLTSVQWLNPRRVDIIDDGGCTVHLGSDALESLARDVFDLVTGFPVTAVRSTPGVLEYLRSTTERFGIAIDATCDIDG